IGTTGRGIGPIYQIKVAHLGIRVQDLFDDSILCLKIEGALLQKNVLLVKLYNRRAFTVNEIVEYLEDFMDLLRPMGVDSFRLLYEALDDDKVVLMEGEHATFLDVHLGTYPFATSSNPTAAGDSAGAGIGPTRFTSTIGIIKAYT